MSDHLLNIPHPTLGLPVLEIQNCSNFVASSKKEVDWRKAKDERNAKSVSKRLKGLYGKGRKKRSTHYHPSYDSH